MQRRGGQFTSVAVALAMAAMVIGLVACRASGSGQEVATDGPAAPTPTESEIGQPTEDAGRPPTEADEGTWAGLIIATDEDALTIDKVEILAGEEAAAARAEDGEPPVEDDLDVPYVRNRNDQLRTIPVAADVDVQVYDCSAGCQLVEWEYADLVAGTSLPYGTLTTPFTVTVTNGLIVSIEEVYLP